MDQYRVALEWKRADNALSTRNKMLVTVEARSILHVKQVAQRELTQMHPGAKVTRLLSAVLIDESGDLTGESEDPKPLSYSPRYYLFKIISGVRVVLWELHADTVEWTRLDMNPKRKPHFYKTLNGAKAVAAEHGCHYDEWHDSQRHEDKK